MNGGRKPKKRWNTASLALHGALISMGLGVLGQLYHASCPASWQHVWGENLFSHVLVDVVIGAVAGAALFGAVSAIRNRLRQDT
jgi:hypothetical protein